VKPYVILTNRKRAVVALVHTVVFLGVAFSGFVTMARRLQAASPVSSWVLAGVYLLVTAALLLLVLASRKAVERLYFGLCATSAGFGLLRQIAGDPPMHPAVYVRVAMLAGAVLVGSRILRSHRSPADGATPRAQS
jgi:protein-S-isoprenylcysteine O-methyltransferase Ste14